MNAGITLSRLFVAQRTIENGQISQTLPVVKCAARPIDILCEAITRRDNANQTSARSNAVATPVEMPALEPLDCLVATCISHGRIANDSKRRRSSDKPINLTRYEHRLQFIFMPPMCARGQSLKSTNTNMHHFSTHACLHETRARSSVHVM